jgi:NADH-quinone oxidoreductase subunit A
MLPYFAILFMMGLVSVIGISLLVVNLLLGPKNHYAEKLTPWECGMEPVGDASTGHFKIHYFLVAILFIVFDVETLFLFPWAVLLTDKSISTFIFIEMIIFIVILAVGLVYAWAKGALDWV